MEVDISDFGQIEKDEIKLFTFHNALQQEIKITNFGGRLHSWICPDRNGGSSDILLGCNDFQGYHAQNPYFGAIVGRYGNRIAYGKFTLNGKEYTLPLNLPPHHLHGGFAGFDRKIFDYTILEGKDFVSLNLSTMSPHLDEGYPGNLTVNIKYTIFENGLIQIEYFAETDQDTFVNLTNHCYFNLSERSTDLILDHKLQIKASFITESNFDLIPSGKLVLVKNTALDFNKFEIIGSRLFNDEKEMIKAKGYDHNYVLDEHDYDMPAAIALEEKSGRRLQVFTTEPAVQLYTGNWLEGVQGKTGSYKDYSGFCLETQHYPDSPNHPDFPSTLLKTGDTYYSKTAYKIDIFDQ